MRNALTRRSFLQMTAIGAGGIVLLSQCKNLNYVSPWVFFTDEEASLVEAISEQIIPSDEWPGAKDAGVARFIDKQLAGPYIRFQEKYAKGLASMKASTLLIHNVSFEKLSWEEQTILLKNMESGKLAEICNDPSGSVGAEKIWESGDDKQFFNLIRDHTMQGFYGSPRHGGNKNYISYKMVGLDYPLIIGQNRYQNQL